MDFGSVAFYYGLELKPQADGQEVVLYGNCAIKSNKGRQNAIKIKGCPPTLTGTLLTLMKALLGKPRMSAMLLLRVAKLVGIRLGVYREVLPGWERYRSKEFDRSHF
jgi:hypothetical protein